MRAPGHAHALKTPQDDLWIIRDMESKLQEAELLNYVGIQLAERIQMERTGSDLLQRPSDAKV